MGTRSAQRAGRAADALAALLGLAVGLLHDGGDDALGNDGGDGAHDVLFKNVAHRCPTPSAPFDADTSMSAPLSTFSLRRTVRADDAEIARARFPETNVPAKTTRDQATPLPPAPTVPEGTRPLGAAPWWGRLTEAVDAAMVDFIYAAKQRKGAKHRRRYTEAAAFRVEAAESAPYTAGLIWDLSKAQAAGGVKWELARPVDCSAVQADSFHIGAHRPPSAETTPDKETPSISDMAEASGFPDHALLYDLEHNCSTDAVVPHHAILSPHHVGALQYWEKISAQMRDEVEKGWWAGPYKFVPVFPFRMVPRNVVEQPRPDGTMKYRICVDLGWPHDGTSPNFHIDLSKQPPLDMARLSNLAQAADILHFAGERIYGFGIDCEAAYRQWAKRVAEQWQQVLLWYVEQDDGSYTPAWYLDRRTTFGDAAMVHKFSRVADMIVHFARHVLDAQARHTEPPEPHLRQWRAFRRSLYPDEPEQWRLYWNMMYIDDHSVVVAGASRAEADRNDIFHVLNKVVGLPAQPCKNDPPSSESLTQLGGTLDFGARWLDRSDRFAAKFAAKLDEALANGEWSFVSCRSIAYSANHLAQFRPADRPRCAPLFAEMRRLLRRGHGNSHAIGPSALAALRFWRQDVHSAGGMPFYPAITMPTRGHPRRADIETDAAGKVGFGAFIHPPGDDLSVAPLYFYGTWTPAESDWHINVKELLVTYWIVELIGSLIPAIHAKMYLVEHIDNTTAIGTAKRNSSNASPELNKLAELRAAAAAKTGWVFDQVYINTKANTRADALSRGDLATFFKSAKAFGYKEAPVLIELDAELRDTRGLFD